jgi:hypothetical protein
MFSAYSGRQSKGKRLKSRTQTLTASRPPATNSVSGVFRGGCGRSRTARPITFEKRVCRLEVDVQALRGSHQTAAQAGLEPALAPIFAPPAAATTAAPPPLPPAGVLDSQDRIGASVVLYSIHQQHLHRKQRSVIDNELSSLHIFLYSPGDCPR